MTLPAKMESDAGVAELQVCAEPSPAAVYCRLVRRKQYRLRQ